MDMIFSKISQTYKPVRIEKEVKDRRHWGICTKYHVFDGQIEVGKVEVSDTRNGIDVEWAENSRPNEYTKFMDISYQLQVEHCLDLGKGFNIESDAWGNSHVLHYKNGKRCSGKVYEENIPVYIKKFGTLDGNEIIRKIIETTPKGERYKTEFLGKLPMYMPLELIKKYLEYIKDHPLLRGKYL